MPNDATIDADIELVTATCACYVHAHSNNDSCSSTKHHCPTFFLPNGLHCIIGASVLQVSMCVLAGSLEALLDQQDWVGQHSGPQLCKSAHHKELSGTSLACHLVTYATSTKLACLSERYAIWCYRYTMTDVPCLSEVHAYTHTPQVHAKID